MVLFWRSKFYFIPILLLIFDFSFCYSVTLNGIWKNEKDWFKISGNETTFYRRCTMKATNSHIDPPEYWIGDPFIPNVTLTKRTCENFSPIDFCCLREQTYFFKDKNSHFQMVQSQLSSCPACLQNVVAFWCGFYCSPYQYTFVNVSSQTSDHVVTETHFLLHPYYATYTFHSCLDVPLPIYKNKKVYEVFSTPPQFFEWIANNHTIKILLEYSTEFSFNTTVTPCSASCSCETCPSACLAPVNLNINFNNSYPSITMFNHNWSIITVIFFVIYVFVIFVFFYSLVFWFFWTRFIRLDTKAIKLLTVNFIIIIVALIGALICHYKITSTTCVIEVLNTKMNCIAFGFAFTAVALFLLTPIFLSIYCYYLLFMTRTKSIIKADNSTSSPWNDISYDYSPFRRGILQKCFFLHGSLCTTYPYRVIILSLLVILIFSIGIFNLQKEENPNKLWVSPSSHINAEKIFFEANYTQIRKEQLIITSLYPGTSIFSPSILKEVLRLQQMIQSINITLADSGHVTTYYDLCHKPFNVSVCEVNSILQLWQNNMSVLAHDPNPLDHLQFCIRNPYHSTCLANTGIPVFLPSVLGGYIGNNYIGANALFVTFSLSNMFYHEAEYLQWEQNFLKLIDSTLFSRIRVSYSAERSMEDQILEGTKLDNITIIICYCILFFYSALALGRIFPIKNRFVFVDSRFSLGLGSILLVLLSIIVSFGICSMFKIKETLFITSVIPFLILAIGTDNIFILVDTYENTDPSTPVETRVATAVSQVGSSMLVASLSEAAVFFFGSFVNMPAIRAFALYGGVAVTILFILQLTTFLGFLTLDAKRAENNRVDCVPCVRLTDYTLLSDTSLEDYAIIKRKKNTGILRSFAQKCYAPFLLHPFTKLVVVLIFFGGFLVGLHHALLLEVGLDETTFLPQDSYLTTFIKKHHQYSSIGPEVYFVIDQTIDYSNVNVQNYYCLFPGCGNSSLLWWAQSIPYMSNLSYPLWLDSYLTWASSEKCCLISVSTQKRCTNETLDCEPCLSLDFKNRPFSRDFMKFLPMFLNSSATPECNIVGHMFGDDIRLHAGKITTSRFKMFHSKLASQSDYINSYKAITQALDEFGHSEVFAYSYFYPYYDQFLNLETQMIIIIVIGVSTVFVVTLVILGNPAISLATACVVGMIEVDILGCMKLWGIQLNAISLVNLLAAVAISIEFCVHLAHTFARSSGTRNQRAYRTLVEIFSPVFSGVTATKLLGTIVLAFSTSELFKTYYFRMYALILIMGCLHGLILLPVIFSLVGTDRLAFCVQKNKNIL